MRKNCVINAITFVLAWKLIYSCAPEYNFISCLLVIQSVILSLLLNFSLPELLDDFLDLVLEEAFEGKNLLRD